MRTSLLAVSLAFAAASLISGCGPAAKPAGRVAGTVTCKGQPVPNGTVNFLSASGAAAQAKISDGAYAVEGSLEVGEYKVYVSPPRPEPQPPGTKVEKPAEFPVPLKFQDPATSGATVKVVEGENKVPIEFKD